MDWLGDAFAWHDAFGHISYLLIAISYYLTRMFWLRALAVLGLSLEILYFHFSGGALNAGIAWNLIFITINLYQLWHLIADTRQARRRAPDHTLLRQGMLATLDDAQLGRLFRMGSWRDLAAGTVLTRQGQTVPELYLLCLGHAIVKVDDVAIARLAPGNFVGEIAFLANTPACATVTTEGSARIFAFDPARLRRLIARDEQIAVMMHRCVGQDLASKLRSSCHGSAALVN